jgi:serine/threonine-protein kinase HipA
VTASAVRRCPLTYAPLGPHERYSQTGLHALSPRLNDLVDFPYAQSEQLTEAARSAGKLSIQGIQPKLSVRLSVSEERFVIVERGGHFILKPQNPLHAELPENEDLTMRLAAMSGIETPQHGLMYARDGSFTYFIKRFDRAGRGAKRAVEDFAQLAGRSRETKYDFSLERVIDIVDRYTSFPAVERVKLFRLVLVSFLCGNEDLHLKNFSIIDHDGVSMLSPAYDLLNTTIALSGAVEESALPLHGKKRGLTRGDLIRYFGGERLQLNQRTIQTETASLRESTARWPELIAVSFLSEAKKDAYAGLVQERSARLFE